MIDESIADDGATHRFWQFIERKRAERRPPRYAFDLEDVARLLEAAEAFDREES